jgi:putative membrane protein
MPALFAADSWSAASFEMSLLAAAAFGLLGVLLLAAGFKVFDWITPKLKIEEELAKGNVAVGIVVGATALGISLIVVRAIGG